MANFIMADSINVVAVNKKKGGGGTEKKKEGNERRRVEQGRKKKEKKKKTTKNQREAWVVGIEACINRLLISLPLDRPTLWETEGWSSSHLGHFSKVRNFYGKSLPWGFSH